VLRDLRPVTRRFLERALLTPRYMIAALAVGVALIMPAASHAAVACGTSTFEAWLADFKTDAAAKGISQAAIASGLNGVTQDKSVLTRDHSQAVFNQTFEEFSGRMVPPRLVRGSNMLKQYGSVLVRIEQAYGVPAEVIVAIWGLETDFGANNGKFPTIRSLATLAYDCRRSDEFRAELMDALRIVERGDVAPADLKGAWAGEIGQTQFMPSSYIKYAVDFDGNGHADLIRSVPDVLASTANYFAGHGWQKGKGYDPGSPNFAVIQQWNKSEVYAKTIAYFATQLAHAP
jgi:lytic murein transglycosylase